MRDARPGSRTHKTLWIIATILVLILIAVLAYGLAMRKKPAAVSPQSAAFNAQAGLGELGAQCGGNLRLPCKPGLVCLGDDQDGKVGVCTRINDNDPGKTQPSS